MVEWPGDGLDRKATMWLDPVEPQHFDLVDQLFETDGYHPFRLIHWLLSRSGR
ncbi:hypothetical protein [Xanthobacter autotrophicus]|uniref:hypothetical protein n=1 Tax=Xanthobacter autotrophicus TaxID=280 RepID=UPI0037289254